jgi:hypothetical protein
MKSTGLYSQSTILDAMEWKFKVEVDIERNEFFVRRIFQENNPVQWNEI